MRLRNVLRKVSSFQVLLLWLLKSVSGLHSPDIGVASLNYQCSLLSSHVLPLALVSLSLPWTSSAGLYKNQFYSFTEIYKPIPVFKYIRQAER